MLSIRRTLLLGCLIIIESISHGRDHKPSFELSSTLPSIILCTEDKLTNDNKVSVRYMIYIPEKQKTIFDCNNKEPNWSRAEIAVRGNSSRDFAKKQYKLTHIAETPKESKKVKMLGMPESEKWVLNAPYVDRSLLRNAFTYQLARKILRNSDWAAPENEFAELWLNDEFNGLFVITQKIERGQGQLNLPKISLSHPEQVSFIAELSQGDGKFQSEAGNEIDFKYPKQKKIDEWQAENTLTANIVLQTIYGQINDFERILASKSFRDPKNGYQTKIDVDSFVDFMLIQEFALNVDGYRRSAYFHKTPNSLIRMGPIWDFNLAYGNLRAVTLQKSSGWQFKRSIPFLKNTFWFKRLMKDDYFRTKLIARYKELRLPEGAMTTRKITADIAALKFALRDAGERDRKRWKGTNNLVQKYLMRTADDAHSHADHVIVFEKWLKNRLAWMDKHIDKI